MRTSFYSALFVFTLAGTNFASAALTVPTSSLLQETYGPSLADTQASRSVSAVSDLNASSDPLQIARLTSELAGGATYCNADPEDIDNFISTQEGRIASFSQDKYEHLLAKLELKNLLTASRVREPADGCSTHLAKFNRALARSH